jgi:hypothetical protein
MNQDIQETLDAIGEDHPLMKQLLRDMLENLSKRDWLPRNLGAESGGVQGPTPAH